MHRTFEQIRSLSPAEQRALFESGDPPTRLHAAWAIALAIGQDTVPSLRAASVGDVPEGLRQQFVVMLAGLQERALLKTIALTDGSVAVRATALRYFVRTTATHDAELAALIAAQLEAGDEDIKLALIEEYDAGRARLTDGQLVALLTDQTSAVRLSAMRAALAKPELSAIVRATLGSSVLMADKAARAELLAELGRGEVVHIIRALARSDVYDTAPVLRALVAQFGRLSWAELEPLASKNDQALTVAILEAIHPALDPDALAWTETILAHGTPPAQDTAYRLLQGALGASPTISLSTATKIAVRQRLEANIEETKTLLTDPSEEDYFDDNSNWLSHLEALRDHLAETIPRNRPR